MRYIVIGKDGNNVGTVYAPNEDAALERAVKKYGLEIEVKEI